jgi:hypothetical protein
MMKAADFGKRDDAPELRALDRASLGRVFLEGQMGA